MRPDSPRARLSGCARRCASARRASGAQLWLVYADSGLVTDVALGENRGVRLTHDHVARALHGPYAFDAAGAIEVSVPAVAPAEPGIAPALVAFVQDTRSGAVLQSLTVPLASCR